MVKRHCKRDVFTLWLLYVLVCCFGYLVICSILTANWRLPSAVTYSERVLHKEIDVVGIAVKPTCVTKRAIEALNEFFGPRRIIVVTTSEASCEKFRSFATNVECLVETDLLPGVSKNTINAFLEQNYGGLDGQYFRGRDSSGWYLQQFLKLGASQYVPDLSEHHVIWDLDMILLKELSIFHDASDHKRQTVINIGGLHSPGYDYSYKNLTGQPLLRAPDGSSFVTHWMVVYNPYMEEYISYLASLPKPQNAPEGTPWVWTILSALDPENLHMGFSEYASYCSWILTHHPDAVYVMPKKTWGRHPFGGLYSLTLIQYLSEDGLCCPTDAAISAMRAMNYQYMGFEVGHNERCNYNDPKYKDGYGV